MFSLNGSLKKSGSVGRWETKQFIGVAQQLKSYCVNLHLNCFILNHREIKVTMYSIDTNINENFFSIEV